MEMSSESRPTRLPPFKKSDPPYPDFVCAVTNPVLTFERLWSVRPYCSRENVRRVQQYRSELLHKRHQDSTPASPTTPLLPCVADLFAALYDLADNRAAAATAASGVTHHMHSSSQPMCLRIAHVPVQQHRVFFIDAPILQPAPDWIDEHRLLTATAAGAAVASQTPKQNNSQSTSSAVDVGASKQTKSSSNTRNGLTTPGVMARAPPHAQRLAQNAAREVDSIFDGLS